MSLIIREAVLEDTKRLLELNIQLDFESEFRAYEPGERKNYYDFYSDYLKNIIDSNNSTIFVAEDSGNLIGLLEAAGGVFNRNKHSAHLAIAVLKEFWGRGIGRQLIENGISWAEENKIHRLDLSVFSYNQKAIDLYEKMGFRKEGLKKDSFKIDEKYVDEFLMALLL